MDKQLHGTTTVCHCYLIGDICAKCDFGYTPHGFLMWELIILLILHRDFCIWHKAQKHGCS